MSVRCAGCMRLKEERPICEHCGYDERQQNNTHQLPVGTVVGGHFTLGRVLGQGGFGITYLGWDSVLKCPVAVKEFFPTGHASRDIRNSTVVTSYDSADTHTFEENKVRFLREAESLAKLWGIPQIVKVLRYFEENGTAYIALEYIAGENLQEYMKRQNRPLTVEELFALLGPVMEALVHVHRADLVHRDISPDNIMVMPDGSTKLLDFGAARYVENPDAARDRNTSTQAILKHGFAPPEQYSSHGALGPWSDVYALCATIYYCLTGKKPVEAMNRIIDDQTMEWEKIPGLSRRQINALSQGMELKPQNRIQSVQQLYDELFGEILEARERAKQEAEAEAKRQEELRRKEEKRKQQEAEAEARRQEELRRKEEKRKQQEARRKEADRLKEERTAARKDKKKKHEEEDKKKRIPAFVVAAAAAVAIAAGLFFLKTPEPSADPEIQLAQTESTVEETIPTVQPTEIIIETTAETHPEEPWRKNVLMKSPLDSAIPKWHITEVIFQDTLENIPEGAWDVSRDRDRSVLAWTETIDQKKYRLFLAGEGGINGVDACEKLFEGYIYLKNVRFNGAFHTEGTLSMANMFNDCYSLTDLDVSDFDTSSVTDMSYMFADCSSLRDLVVSGFDTSAVTNMQVMFSGCSGLTTLDVSGWDTSDVTDASWMFGGCSSLTTLDVSNWDTSNVTYMGRMFDGCSSLNTLDVSNWDTSNVTYMASMFCNCSGLTTLDVGNWDTSKVWNVSHMFQECSGLTTLDVSNWETSNVTYMGFLFDGCSSLKTLDASSWDVSKVTDRDFMFFGCSKLPEECKRLGGK